MAPKGAVLWRCWVLKSPLLNLFLRSWCYQFFCSWLAELPELTEKILFAIMAQPRWIHFGLKTWGRRKDCRILQKHQQLFGGQVTLFEVNSTRLIFGESKVVVAFNVWQPLKVLFKIWTPVIHWNNNCSVMCSNKLCLVDPSTRGFHHVSKFVNWRDEVLLVQFLYDAKTSIRGKLRVASNQKRISNWKMELKNCPPS